ncbi:MAG TPA: FxLYD domain-containing protein [Anaerolineales bacterium]|nr:FxLYD domain-containing protein [Anaerolineales bacterium]
MKMIAQIAVIAFVIRLSACAAQPVSPTYTPQLLSNTATTSAAEQPSETAPTEPDATDTAAGETPEDQSLSPEETYQTIAAVHANILLVESWLIQGISDNQREAMPTPIAEMSIAPLADIFQAYMPQPSLAESWQQAQNLHNRFYPQMAAWLNGELAEDDFAEALIALKIESNQMITEADQIAYQEFGIDVAEYQPDYALAMDIVFALAATAPGDLAGPRQLTDLLAASEAEPNPDLLVREVTPVIYQFAGSDLLLLIGLVENTGTENLELVEIEAQFFDVDDAYLGTLWGTTASVLIKPGKTYPFSASLVIDGDDTEIREQWQSYQVSAAAHPLSYAPQAYYHEFDLVLLAVIENEPGEYTIGGSLTNLGTETVDSRDVFISAAGFDAGGALVGVGKGAAIQESVLNPGDSVPFEVVIQTGGEEPVRYQFFAEMLIVPE